MLNQFKYKIEVFVEHQGYKPVLQVFLGLMTDFYLLWYTLEFVQYNANIQNSKLALQVS